MSVLDGVGELPLGLSKRAEILYCLSVLPHMVRITLLLQIIDVSNAFFLIEVIMLYESTGTCVNFKGAQIYLSSNYILRLTASVKKRSTLHYGVEAFVLAALSWFLFLYLLENAICLNVGN
jgi:hypothetical protein